MKNPIVYFLALFLISQIGLGSESLCQKVGDLGTMPKVVDDSFPYANSVVAIGFYFKSKDYKSLNGQFYANCTGTVINRKQVLTAGHCIKTLKNFFKIDFSDDDTLNKKSSRDLDKLNIEYRVVFSKNLQKHYHSKVEAQANFDDLPFSMKVDTWIAKPGTWDRDDVGLITLNGEIPKKYKSVPIIGKNQLVLNRTYRHMGYNFAGTKGLLRYIDTANVDVDVIKLLQNIGEDVPAPTFEQMQKDLQFSDGEIGYFLVKGNSPIGGSSGGPIMAKVDGRWTLVGVIGEGAGHEFRVQPDNWEFLKLPINPESSKYVWTETAAFLGFHYDWLNTNSHK